jgi:single-stranded-DNA-specific exonuclease
MGMFPVLKQVLIQPKIEALYFSPPVEKLAELPGVGGEIDILGEVQWNYFAGRKSVQILVKDCQASRGNA